jgi:hypothetical protein
MAAITTCLLCGTTLTDMEAALADLKVLHVAARAMFRVAQGRSSSRCRRGGFLVR